MDSLPLAANISVMQPSGSPSTHPSQDSLSSGDTNLFSDDDSGVFLSEEGGATPGTCLGRGGDSPASHWARDGFGEADDPASSEVGGGGGALGSAHTPSTLSLPSSSSWSSSGLGQSTAESGGGESTGGTRGDALFAQKCLELQGFVRPLLELLNGLKKGRFDKGLSTFQQSVAMDRIQRIVGVLQKPHIGEKYLPTLLQVEMMLKNWFPQVTLCPTSSAVSVDQSRQGTSSGTTPPHKHRDQLHIPVKKRRLSWSDSDFSSTPPPVACRCSKVKGHEKWNQQKEVEGTGGPGGGPAPSKQADRLDESGGETSGHKAVHWSEPRLTWVHVAPIFSPPKSCPSHEGRGGAKQGGSGYVVLTVPPPTSRGSPATQDSSVSSTTPFSDPVGCHNQPLASANPAKGRGQSPPIMTQP